MYGVHDLCVISCDCQVTQVMSSEADFESVSQVGSHASFPQWTDTGIGDYV